MHDVWAVIADEHHQQWFASEVGIAKSLASDRVNQSE